MIINTIKSQLNWIQLGWDFKNEERISFVLYENKNHTIIKSEESIKYMRQMDVDLENFVEDNNGVMTDEHWRMFLSSYDLKKYSEPDEEVLEVIYQFLQK